MHINSYSILQTHIGIKGRIISPGNERLIANISVTDLDEKTGGYIDHDIMSSKSLLLTLNL